MRYKAESEDKNSGRLSVENAAYSKHTNSKSYQNYEAETRNGPGLFFCHLL